MGTAFSSNTARQHRNLQGTLSCGTGTTGGEFRVIDAEYGQHVQLPTSSSMSTGISEEDRGHYQLPPTPSKQPLKSMTSQVSASPSSSTRPGTRRQQSRLLSRFRFKSVKILNASTPAAVSEEASQGWDYSQENDSGCLQEETSFSVVPNPQPVPVISWRRPEQVAEAKRRPERRTTGSRIAATVVNRYRSLSNFFARSSSVIGPANGDSLQTRVAYNDAGIVYHRGNDIQLAPIEKNANAATKGAGKNERQTVSLSGAAASASAVSSSSTAAASVEGNAEESFAVCWRHKRRSAIVRSKIFGEASSTDLLSCLDEFVRIRCQLSACAADQRRSTPKSPGMTSSTSQRLVKCRRGLITTWLRAVDQSLLKTGWQDMVFIDPVSIVVVFALVRDAVSTGKRPNGSRSNSSSNNNNNNVNCSLKGQHIKQSSSFQLTNSNIKRNWFLASSTSTGRQDGGVTNKNDDSGNNDVVDSQHVDDDVIDRQPFLTFATIDRLQVMIMASLYVAYSYIGCEISYPLKPFVFDNNRHRMLTINDDEGYRDDEDDDCVSDDGERRGYEMSQYDDDDDISYSCDEDDDFDEEALRAAAEWRQQFWDSCLAIVGRSSSTLLRLNSDSTYFNETLDALLSVNRSKNVPLYELSSSSSKYQCDNSKVSTRLNRWPSVLCRET